VGLVSPPAKKPGHGISLIGVLWRHVGFFSPAISGTSWRVATWILRVHFGGENKTARPPARLQGKSGFSKLSHLFLLLHFFFIFLFKYFQDTSSDII
jgi:hypothetical protein